jgi:hypothetical protein
MYKFLYLKNSTKLLTEAFRLELLMAVIRHVRKIAKSSN